MNYLSTRNKDLRMSAAQAIAKGLAPDGGLMTPAVLPRLPSTAMETMREPAACHLYYEQLFGGVLRF